ncbi:MAG: hypothetical protein M0Z49_00740 [Chloroflexi bacterium]|nr:hypothetical protein [Chloroflexota bacterium]
MTPAARQMPPPITVSPEVPERGGRPGRPDDLIEVLAIVERVYENACAFAEDGLMPFDALDLSGAIAILRRHLTRPA